MSGGTLYSIIKKTSSQAVKHSWVPVFFLFLHKGNYKKWMKETLSRSEGVHLENIQSFSEHHLTLALSTYVRWAKPSVAISFPSWTCCKPDSARWLKSATSPACYRTGAGPQFLVAPNSVLSPLCLPLRCWRVMSSDAGGPGQGQSLPFILSNAWEEPAYVIPAPWKTV